MSTYLSVACVALCLVGQSFAFAPVPSQKAAVPADTALHAAAPDRRTFLSTAGVASAGLFFGGLVGPAVEPANAFGGGLKGVNSRLQSFGVPPMSSLPDGFSPLVEVWGKGKNRSPLLVNFAHPSTWVVTLPSQDVNGEDGTIQAGEYAKGDTATLFVYPDPGSVKVSEQPKSFYEDCLIKAISQKGANVYQDFKVTRTEVVKGGYKNQEYVLVDFKYTLLTGAGFEVERKGVASITSVGNSVQVLWTATIAARFKKIGTDLRLIAESFRVYADGLDLLVPVTKEFDDGFDL